MKYIFLLLFVGNVYGIVCFSQTIEVKYNTYYNDKTTQNSTFISDTVIISINDYCFTILNIKNKTYECGWKLNKYNGFEGKKNSDILSFKEAKRYTDKYYPKSEIDFVDLFNPKGFEKSFVKGDKKVTFKKETKEINGFLCKNAHITWITKEKNEYDIWYYKIPNINCKYINKFTIFDAIEGVIMEMYNNGEIIKNVTDIVYDSWFVENNFSK